MSASTPRLVRSSTGFRSETAVFVVSDHGGGPVVDRTIFLNRYLAQLGLLNYNQKRLAA